LVIRHLQNKAALKSIASLLRVNKYVCGVALPILYEDPFAEMYTYSSGCDEYDSKSPAFLRLKRLLQVLLRSLPISTSAASECRRREGGLVTELLRAAYFQEQDQKQQDGDDHVGMKRDTGTTGQDVEGTSEAPLLLQQPPTLFPYYSFLTNVAFEEHDHASECLQERLFFLQQPAVLEYLQHSGEGDQYLAQEPYRSFMQGPKEVVDASIVSQATKRQLQRDLTWAMCFSNAEHIRTLHISIADIGRYLDLAPRFKVLSQVDIQVDKPVTLDLLLGVELTPEEKEILARLKKERTKHLEDVILFLHEHQRHNPNVIKTARFANGHGYPEKVPEEYHFRLLQTLPPLNRPRKLGTGNWAQFAANIAGTDLSCVKEIDSGYLSKDVMYLSRILDQGPFLHRCRSLEIMDIASFGEDVFKWAVQERKEFDRDNGDSVSPSRSLVPLRWYHVQFKEPSYGRQINDVAYAFGNSLESLQIDGYQSDNHSEQQQYQRDFTLGRSHGDDDNNDNAPASWPILPRLRKLQVETHQIFLRLHRRLFSQLPRLSELSLKDSRNQYSLTDVVVHWEPVEMLELEFLTLSGTPAICFHPDTLKNTPKLYSLELGMVETNGFSFIPDPEEFDEIDQEGQEASESHSDDTNSLLTHGYLPTRRYPVWTWDWELPKLRQITLTSEFAYRFKFQMLAGTPNLAYFDLNIKSLSRKHRRTVGIADLVKPGFQHPALARVLDREREQQEKRKRLPYWDPNAHHASEDQEAEDDVEEEEVNEEEEEDEILKEFEFLHLPALRFFSLTGPWVFDHRSLKALFSMVAPKISTIYLRGSYGFSISEWVQSTSLHLPNVDTCIATFRPLPRMIAEAGLVEREMYPSDEDEMVPSYLRMNGRVMFKLAVRPVGRANDTPAIYEFQ
ncbi:hypothetical protein BGZ95_011963, partial [Linnemannia exigua]